MFYPPKGIIDNVTKEATGNKLAPTVDEKLRRKYDAELPQDPKGPFLPKNWEMGSAQDQPVQQEKKNSKFLRWLHNDLPDKTPPQQNVPNIKPLVWTDQASMNAPPSRPSVSEPPPPPAAARKTKNTTLESRYDDSDFSLPYTIGRPMTKQNASGIHPSGYLSTDRNDFLGRSGPHVVPAEHLNKNPPQPISHYHPPSAKPPARTYDLAGQPATAWASSVDHLVDEAEKGKRFLNQPQVWDNLGPLGGDATVGKMHRDFRDRK